MLSTIRDKYRGKFLWAKKPAAQLYTKLVDPDAKNYMQWQPLIQQDKSLWNKALQASKNGPRILLGTTKGHYTWETNFDSALAIALTLRGAQVHVLVCDKHLSACQPWEYQRLPNSSTIEDTYSPPGSICSNCFDRVSRAYKPLSLLVHSYSAFTTNEEIQKATQISESVCMEDMSKFTWEGLAVGEHAIAGAIRFFANTDLDKEPLGRQVAQRYLKSALITTFATKRLIRKYGFKVISGSHGIYVPQGMVNEVARSLGVKVVNWHAAYRKQCLIFSEGDTYHKTLLNEPVSNWENMQWNHRTENEIMEYLHSRQYGTNDWISFHPNPNDDSLSAVREMGVDFTRPVVGLLTNVAWDAQLHYGETPFRDMMDWLIQTVAYFKGRPDLQLLIRVHPAEISGRGSRQPAVKALHDAFPEIPKNVFIIPPESTISTYDTMVQCNAVIIYATKTGIELAARGIPVLVAGEGWIKNKGFALDASSADEYFAHLENLPLSKRLTQQEVQRARMYAYHFFMRRMIPCELLEPEPNLKMRIRSLSELLPGLSSGLDVICDGILNGGNFVYHAEAKQTNFIAR